MTVTINLNPRAGQILDDAWSILGILAPLAFILWGLLG